MLGDKLCTLPSISGCLSPGLFVYSLDCVGPLSPGQWSLAQVGCPIPVNLSPFSHFLAELGYLVLTRKV